MAADAEADATDTDFHELSLSERVDEVEKALGLALGDYRRRAEQVLAKHIEALEKTDAAHQLEVANLRAENGLLREKLHIGGGHEPNLLQSVMFQPQGAQQQNTQVSMRQDKVKGINKSPTRNFQSKNENSEDSRILLNARKGGDKNAANKPGGTWQNFVAWVPNGAALRTPEPWKPLPIGTAPVAGQTPQPGKESNKDGQLSSVVPGTVTHNDDAESNSSASSQEKDFEVLEVWKASKHTLDKLRKTREAGDGESRYTRDQSIGSADTEEQNVFEEDTPHGCIIHPHCNKRIGWDLSSLCMVVYDMIMIPMSVFQMSDNAFLDTMEWTTRLFWTIDMGWSLCTGVVLPDGQVNFSFHFILKRYLKTWFALDIFIVGSDWAMAALENGSNMGFSRLARTFRTVRVVRLLRLARMQEIVATITERIQSDKLSFILSILKLLVFVMAISHVIACMWWGVGARPTENVTWVQSASLSSASLENKYLVSLHWALAQFTGGMDEVIPGNAFERFFAIIVWLFAFMAACIIVSILTSNLTQLHIIGGSQSRQLATLRKYLNQNQIPSNLALRVQRSAQHAVSGDLTQDTVELLTVVSEPLKVEMHFNMFGSVLRNHPFFCDYIGESPQVMRRVCHYAMSSLLLAAGDIVFNRGDVPPEPKMYLVWKGTLDYVCFYGDMQPVTEKHWVSEANLWTRWKHKGTLTATNDVKLAVLDAKMFQDIVRRHKETGAFDPKLYAADFVAHMNKADELDDLTSLCSR